MSLAFSIFEDGSRLKALLDHFSIIDDPRGGWRILWRKCCCWWCAGRWPMATATARSRPGARRTLRSCAAGLSEIPRVA